MPLSQDAMQDLKAIAIKQLGKKYLWAAKPEPTDPDPQSFDCSGFIYWCYARIGIIVPQGSQRQYEASEHVAVPQVGDIAFFRRYQEPVTHHVGMLYDAHNVIEARGDPYNRVILRPRSIWEAWHEFVGWNRFKVVSKEASHGTA